MNDSDAGSARRFPRGLVVAYLIALTAGVAGGVGLFNVVT